MFDYTQDQTVLLDALHRQWVLYKEAGREISMVRHGNHVSKIDFPIHQKASAKRNSALMGLRFLIGSLMESGVPKYRIKKVLNPDNPENAQYLITQVEDFWSRAGTPPTPQNLFLTEPNLFEHKNRVHEVKYEALKEIEFRRHQQQVRLRREGKNRERLSADCPVVQAVLAAHALGLTVNEITEYYEGGTRATIRKMIEKFS